MNHFVPDFDADHDSIIPSSFLPPSKSSAMAEEEDLMELLWHNGQVVFHNQTQLRPPDVKKSSPPPDLTPVGPPPPPPPPDHHSNLFIHEGELASWLHYPLNHDDFSSDLLYSASPSQPQRISPTSTPERPKIPVSAPRPPERPKIPVSAPRPPVPPTSRTVNETKTVRNFANFSRFRGKSTTGGGVESGQPSSSSAVERESDVTRRQGGGVEYGQPSSASAVKAVERESLTPTGSDMTRRQGGADTRWTINGGVSSAASGGCAVATYDISGTSSWKGKAEQSYSQPATETTEIDGDRKRKGREAIVETESRSEETKQGRGSTSTKRSRAAEVHNLSERRRRDRINEKMRTLQELIPRCNKSDKASMLDEAIEYIKSLQLQVQMMSMGYSMTPMMYPGMQQYMAMGMGLGIGMNPPPFMPFPTMAAHMGGPPLPTMAAHMGGPPFPSSPFPLPNFQLSDPSRLPVHSQQPDPASQPLQPDPVSQPLQPLQPQMQQPDPASQPVQPQIQQPHPCFMDPYQQFLGLHPLQASMLQNQATAQPSSSKEPEDEQNLPEG